jgi:hypothetical protein
MWFLHNSSSYCDRKPRVSDHDWANHIEGLVFLGEQRTCPPYAPHKSHMQNITASIYILQLYRYLNDGVALKIVVDVGTGRGRVASRSGDTIGQLIQIKRLPGRPRNKIKLSIYLCLLRPDRHGHVDWCERRLRGCLVPAIICQAKVWLAIKVWQL